MNEEQKQIILQACAYDPERVVELLRANWSENELYFKLIFKQP